ncbi:unnamed protein product, partial [Aphanomyces euteiches]
MKLTTPTCLLLCLATLAHGNDLDGRAQAIVDKMSVDELIGTMTQINIDYIMTVNKTVNATAVQELADQYVGSMLNTPISDDSDTPPLTVPQWRDMITKIQDFHTKTGHPIIYGLDSVHGANYVKD